MEKKRKNIAQNKQFIKDYLMTKLTILQDKISNTTQQLKT